MTTRVVDFSDAFHAALGDYVRGGEYPFVDACEYEYLDASRVRVISLDDFTRKTSRVRAISVRFASTQGLLLAVKKMMAALLRAGVCPERIFYRIEDRDEEGNIQVSMWGMKELPPEAVEMQEVN